MPFDMQDYKERAENAINTIKAMQSTYPPYHQDYVRLGGKIEGVYLMLDYLRAYKD